MNKNLNPAQFGDYSIEYSGQENPWGGQVGAHKVVATHRDTGEEVGFMRWTTGSKRPGEIVGVDVLHDHRRKGIATALYNYAQGSGIRPSPKHSPMRTDAGEAWAKAVGGRRPRRDSGSTR